LQTSQGYIIRILQHFVDQNDCLDQNFSYKVKGPFETR
jgi:hypothetical protein